MKLTKEKKYFINMMISCLYQEKPRPHLTISRLKSIRDNNHYNDQEQRFLNVIRERHKEQLKKKYKAANQELDFKRKYSNYWYDR